MLKNLITAVVSVLFSMTAFATTHIVDRPGFDSLNPQDAEVAIQSKASANADLAKTDPTSPDMSADDQASEETAQQDEQSDEQATAVAETEKPADGFSVRLVSLHPRKQTKIKTVAPKSTTEKPGATAMAKADTNYTIQLSSFLTEQEAKSALARFQNNSVADVWISTADALGKTRFRVYTGHFKTLNQARAAQAKAIHQSGVKEAFAQKVFAKLTAKNG